MSFRINTNVASMRSHASGVQNNRELDLSLQKLSSGLRINSSADDASGMVIADSLRSQANSLGQAIRNANDAIGVIQTADNAMDQQIKILDTIKVKATQAAADGQNTQSRQAIQEDIARLLEELDTIANTTAFNGMQLLSGSFINKEFQIGAYSREVVKISIGNTSSATIGAVRSETSGVISSAVSSGLVFVNTDGTRTSVAAVKISTSVGTGLGAMAEAINRVSDQTGVRANAIVRMTGSNSVAAGSIRGLVINGITLGTISTSANDSNGHLRNTINAATAFTGVTATVDGMGRLSLNSSDGRGVIVKTSASTVLGFNKTAGVDGSAMSSSNGKMHFGRITLTSLGSRDILISGTSGANPIANSAFMNKMTLSSQGGIFSTVNLKGTLGVFTNKVGASIGAFANAAESAAAGQSGTFLGPGVTTRSGAMLVMDIAESAMKMLDKIRSDLGSVQNQLTVTINNITVTEVNIRAAESQIRDADFAAESANFSKRNLLAQSGSFALSQASAIPQNVLKLLQ